MTLTSARLPLEGVRVLDFCWAVAGPSVTRCLGDFGAEVIKVESTARLDHGRMLPPVIRTGGAEVGALFVNNNCDKLGVTLNMAHPTARDIARRLAAMSDVVINNFASDALERWGLGYDDLVKVKPDIITVSMPLMGTDGPRANYGGYGTGLQAMAGLHYLTGFPDDPPLASNIAYPDFGPNPMHTITAILAALHYRNRTGQGQHIELCQLESTVSFGAVPVLDYLANGVVEMRHGNRAETAAPHGAYRCRGDDRWCAIAVFTDAEWDKLTEVMGRPAWTRQQEFGSFPARKEHEDELDRLLEAWTVNRDADQTMMSLQQAGVAAGVVQSGKDITETDPQVRERGYFLRLKHPEVGEVVCEDVTIKLSASPGKVRRPGPGVGQDNEYVYRQLLQMSEEEINQCYVDGVFD
ncbi:MAG: CoA transferase [Chloroflexota bacterium]